MLINYKDHKPIIMEEKLRRLIDESVFKTLVLEAKKGIYTDELYHIGEKIWKEAQKDLIEKIEDFEKQEKVLIITEDDKEMLHGFDYTSQKHIDFKKRFKSFLRESK